MASLLFCLLLGNSNQPTSTEKKANPSVEKARGLSREELRKYLSGLGVKKQFDDLMDILHSDVAHAFYAAEVIAVKLDPEKAVPFCAELERGQRDLGKWMLAINGLRRHPKVKIIGYIKESASSKDPFKRACWYKVCGIEGWDDLVNMARKDVGDKTLIDLPSQREQLTLGGIAKEYIERVRPERNR